MTGPGPEWADVVVETFPLADVVVEQWQPDVPGATAEPEVQAIPGPAGGPGPVGPVGPPGPAGPVGDVSVVDAVLGYRHVQMTPEAVWTIEHPLAFLPNITVVDSGGSEVEGDVEYPPAGGVSPIVVRFTAPFGGTAFLS